MRDRLGVCQWFHYQAYEDVEQAVTLLRQLGVRHLRTGISWADFHRPQGQAWYDWQMAALSEFEVLLSVWHTPPSIAEGGTCASPPRRLDDYAAFIGQLIEDYGHQFADLELWNEPNNLYKWDFRRFDPHWEKFGAMVRGAGERAQRLGKRTVLGGMIPVDPRWLNLMKSYGVLDVIDVVAIHGFPEMWWENAPCWDSRGDWRGWDHKVQTISTRAEPRPIWITETGLATCNAAGGRSQERVQLQAQKLREAAAAPTERVYWYCLRDLDPAREAIEGFHVDENEYHLGLVDWHGRKKPAWSTMQQLLSTPSHARSGAAATRVAGHREGLWRTLGAEVGQSVTEDT